MASNEAQAPLALEEAFSSLTLEEAPPLDPGTTVVISKKKKRRLGARRRRRAQKRLLESLKALTLGEEEGQNHTKDASAANYNTRRCKARRRRAKLRKSSQLKPDQKPID